MAVYGACLKTKPSFSFFRGQFWGIGSSYIRCDLLSDTESRKRCFSFSSCQGPNTRPNDTVTAMMTPMTFPRVAFASMMRNSEKSLPTSKESIEHPFLGSSESSVSENIFLLFNVSQPLGRKNYLYTPYPSICGVWHLQISFHQHVMRWTSRSDLTNSSLIPDPKRPWLHLYKKPITPGWLVWLCFWNWKALSNTPKNSKETTHATCIAHHPIHP